MINNLLIRMMTLAVGLSTLPSVLSVCPGGDIGIGNGFASSGGEFSLIFSNNCGIIDTRSVLDGNICGSYENGASVQCNAGTQTPNTAQTGDGANWGPCFSTSESCGNGKPVHFCCSRA